jgi:hypothetical protein
MIRVYIDNLTNVRLVAEVAVSAIVPSGTVKSFEAELVRTDGLPWAILPSGYILKASTVNAEAMNIAAFGGNY